MDWKTEVKLTYRIFVRQHRNVEDQFRDVLDRLGKAHAPVEGYLDRNENVEVKMYGPTDMLIPLRQIDVKRAEEEGKLVLDRGGGDRQAHVLVYQWQVVVDVTRSCHSAELWLDSILQSTGQVWTNVEIKKECLTDVVPI